MYNPVAMEVGDAGGPLAVRRRLIRTRDNVSGGKCQSHAKSLDWGVVTD
jgi:hypothetical protein